MGGRQGCFGRIVHLGVSMERARCSAAVETLHSRSCSRDCRYSVVICFGTWPPTEAPCKPGPKTTGRQLDIPASELYALVDNGVEAVLAREFRERIQGARCNSQFYATLSGVAR